MKDLLIIIVNNIKGSLFTTIIGCIILAIGIGCLLIPSLVIEQYICVELIVLGVVVACLRDPRNNNQNKGEGAALGLVLVITISLGCTTERRCVNKFGTSSSSDSVRTELVTIIKDSLITIPSDTVRLYIENPCDSTGNLKPSFTRVKSDTGKSIATVVIDKTGISVECECAEEKLLIKKIHQQIRDFVSQKSQQKIVKPAPRWSWLAVYTFLMGLIVGFITCFKIKK